MLLTIDSILSPEQVAAARRTLAAAEWVDGRVTAGYQAQEVKRNAQVRENSAAAAELGEVVLAGLARSPRFLAAALPLRVFPPMFNSYAGGQTFGTHVDTAIRQLSTTGQRIRTDLSATLFLTDPADYDGGELVVEDSYGEKSVKLAAGSLVLYPATSLHRVEPVTRGNRVSSFFWIQSMVRQDAQRTLLFELDSSIQRLAALAASAASATPTTPSAPATEGAPAAEMLATMKQTSVQLTGVYHNLLRQWAEM